MCDKKAKVVFKEASAAEKLQFDKEIEQFHPKSKLKKGSEQEVPRYTRDDMVARAAEGSGVGKLQLCKALRSIEADVAHNLVNFNQSPLGPVDLSIKLMPAEPGYMKVTKQGKERVFAKRPSYSNTFKPMRRLRADIRKGRTEKAIQKRKAWAAEWIAKLRLRLRIQDDRVRTQALREELLAEKTKVAAEFQRLARQKEIESAELRLSAADFAHRLAGVAQAKRNRWRAFKRVLELAGPLPPNLAPTLESDWEKWDKCEGLKWNVDDAWANKFHQAMLLRAKDLRENKNDAVHQWWRQQRVKIPQPELLLPALPTATALTS